MDISAFPQHDEVTETFAAQNALIQQLQRENAQLTQQIADLQGELAEERMDFFGIKDKEIADLKQQLADAQERAESNERMWKEPFKIRMKGMRHLTGDVSDKIYKAMWEIVETQQWELDKTKHELATAQVEVERLRGAISKVMPRLSLAVDPMEDADLSPEGYCDDEACPYCVLKKALSAPQPDVKDKKERKTWTKQR